MQSITHFRSSSQKVIFKICESKRKDLILTIDSILFTALNREIDLYGDKNDHRPIFVYDYKSYTDTQVPDLLLAVMRNMLDTSTLDLLKFSSSPVDMIFKLLGIDIYPNYKYEVKND